ncbi:MAG: YdcF family protein, partial [Propionibacteriaceae bacterium]|nr:YdcF family protein [Propionibacteriaceae bacterium]
LGLWGMTLLLPTDGETTAGVYVLLGLILFAIFVVVILGVVLILNGFTMLRKEGRRLSNLLGLILGLVMVTYVVLAIVSVVNNNAAAFLWVLFAGIPMGYLGFGFVAYLLYSGLYLLMTKRFKKTPEAVIVLGSGLINNKVPPLLASRLNRGRSLVDQAPGDHKPLLIVSGGQGSDERRSEASAMAEYLVDSGVRPESIIQEDLSTTTQENIAYSKDILNRQGITGPVVAVTNNFHAFRAALILRRQKVKGYSLGSPTARYYWPAATIREYAAILADSLGFTITCVVLSFLPLLGITILALIG